MNTELICTPGSNAFEVSNMAQSGNTNPADWLTELFSGGRRSDAGVVVNGYTALTHCPLWQGVNIIAGDIGQVPIRLLKNEFTEQRNHPAWNLLRVRPNELQSPSVFKETLMQWALIWGNGVAWIKRRGSIPVDLIPLRPDCLRPELVSFDDGQVILYHYYSPTRGERHIFLPDDVIHIQGITSDGVWGYPLHEIAKNCIGQGLALELHGNMTFSNGAVPSGVLEAPATPGVSGISKDPEARANLRNEWNAVHRGPDKAGAIAILWEGITYKATSHTNIDAQWIEAKKLDRVNCASLLNLPAHKLNALEDSSVRSNLEEQNETYKQMTLTRWSNRLDEEFRRKLLTEKEWLSDSFRFIFDFDAFLRGDIDTLTTVADRMVKATIWNPNEARRYIGYAPRAGGEVYGSPAINPNPRDGETAPAGDSEPKNTTKGSIPTKTTVHAAHRDLIVDRLTQMATMEARLLRQAAQGNVARGDGDAKNFLEWLDEFYVSNGEPSKFSGIFDSIVGKSLKAAVLSGLEGENLPALVNSWGFRRHRAILEACSHVKQDELPAAIEAFVSTSPDEVAEQLIGAALGEKTWD